MLHILLYLVYSFVTNEKWEMIMNIKSCALFISDEQSNVNGLVNATKVRKCKRYPTVHIYDVETSVSQEFGI